MNNKQYEKLLYSVVGVAAMFLIVVAVNFILSFAKQRLDFTHERLYTLSGGTRKILAKLDTPVEIRFYFTQGDKEIDPGLKSWAQRVEDLLAEYKQAAKGKIRIKKLNPQPDSDAEDSAKLDGIEGQQANPGNPFGGEVFYLGLAVNCVDEKVAIPALTPARERLLEYDISRAISRAAFPSKPVVGLMSPLPVFGQPMNPMMMRMGQQGQEPWMLVSELQRDFTVKQVGMDVDKIDDEIKVLLVIHPKDITDKAQYAIDQFVMRGGKLIAFLDALSLVDKPANPQNPMMANMPGGPSNLEKLLKAWGLTFENSKVIADVTFKTRLSRGQGRVEEVPTFLSLTPEGIDRQDALTSQLDNIMIPFGGVFTGTPAPGLKQTVLLKTTTESQQVDSMMASMAGESVMKDFKASGTSYALAVRLAGKFKTAFPDGKPAEKAEEKPDDKDKKDEKKADGSLKETKDDNVVILVGDSDFVYDQFCVRVQNFFGQRIAQPLNGNLTLAQNMVEQLAGDSNLIGVRSRASVNRPFTVVQKMEAKAQSEYRETIKRIETDLQETQKKLGELQAKKEGGQRFILSPEQQKELEKFRRKEADAKVELKKLRKNLRRDVESLETGLKWLNILGMPLLVAAAGIVLGISHSKRARAQ